MSAKLAEAYEASLSDLPPDRLRWALNATLRNVQFWPTPAHVRQQLEQAETAARKRAADEAWRAVRKRLDNWHYDPGVEGGPWLPVMRARHPGKDYTGRVDEFGGGFLVYPPRLAPEVEYAVRHVGGWERLKGLDGKNHDFVRRDFVAAVERAKTLNYLPEHEDASGGFQVAGEGKRELPEELVGRFGG